MQLSLMHNPKNDSGKSVRDIIERTISNKVRLRRSDTPLHCGVPVGVNYEMIPHYCRMLLTRPYDQRPFEETMCDAIIANGGVKNRQKRCKTFAMTDASNTVRILVACAMKGIWFSSINCLR